MTKPNGIKKVASEKEKVRHELYALLNEGLDNFKEETVNYYENVLLHFGNNEGKTVGLFY